MNRRLTDMSDRENWDMSHQDEVLRFKQVTGLAELFRDREFSEAWEATTA